MIPIDDFEQFQQHDGWLADARPLQGFKIAKTADKVSAPRESSVIWQWSPVHRTEVLRMKQAYSNPDLKDPIRCSYITLTAPDAGVDHDLIVDMEPCRTFHDDAQLLHTLWSSTHEAIMQAFADGSMASAIGIERAEGYRREEEQVYFDGKYLYRLPWPAECELTDERLQAAGARPVNGRKDLWFMPLPVVQLSAVQFWTHSVPRQNSSLIIWRSADDPSLWSHTPPLHMRTLDVSASLTIGSDGMDELDRDLTLTLDFALDAARIVGKWCGPAAVDALELPQAMLALNTVNLSNLHPSERALTPIGLTFSQATVWLMGRSVACKTPEHCLDFRALFTDLFMGRSCIDANRMEVRKEKTRDQEIPQLDAGAALKAAAAYIAKREKSRLKRQTGRMVTQAAEAAEREREHEERLNARRRRRGNGRSRLK